MFPVCKKVEKTSANMKILHLASQDIGGGGGAFEASYRLHCNMKAAGVDSVMVVLNKTSKDETVFEYSDGMTIPVSFRRIRRNLRMKLLRRYYQPRKYFYVDDPQIVSAQRVAAIAPFVPDVIIAHWISNFLTAGNLHELSLLTGAPVLLYLIDIGPLTGGCHYSLNCTGYTRQCGICPQLKSGSGKKDLSFSQWRVRHDAVQNMDITPVAGSAWLMDRVAESSIFCDKPAKKIMLGLKTDVFCPLDQAEARQKLGLPLERKIIFFGAANIHEERKGLRYLIESLRKLYVMLEGNLLLRDDIMVVIAGSLDNSATKLDILFEHRHIGFLRGDIMLAAGYQSADIFVNASVEDAGPMMINESILCGTPVVSFDMGVAPDLVKTGSTGYCASLRDSDDMAFGLFQLLAMDDVARTNMRSECRILGVKLCHSDVQVRSFMELCTLRVSEAHVKLSGRTK